MDYGGELEFSAGEKKFHLSRSFYKKDIRQSLICLDDGEELSVPHGDLQMILGGISESIYDNTVSIGQLRSETDSGLVRELENHLSNYSDTGAGDVNISRAETVLKKKKKQWQDKKNESEIQWHKRQETVDHQMEYVQNEIEGLKSQLENMSAIKNDTEKRQQSEKNMMLHRSEKQQREETLREQREIQNRQKEDRKAIQRIDNTWKITLILAGLLLVSGIFAGKFLTNNIGLWMSTAGVVLLIGSFLLQARGKSKENDFKSQRLKEYEQQKWKESASETEEKQYHLEDTAVKDKISRLKGQKEMLEQQMNEKNILLRNLRESREEMEEVPEEILACEVEMESLELAMSIIGGLSDTIRLGIGSRLQKRMEEILGEITGGRYERISMDANMKISLHEWNRIVPLYQVSRGTVEQVYFALRMAVMDVLCQEEMPVMLDDVFAMYDENRLMQTLKWLEKWGGQVVIFTCHRRETELAEKAGIKVNTIAMEEQVC